MDMGDEKFKVPSEAIVALRRQWNYATEDVRRLDRDIVGLRSDVLRLEAELAKRRQALTELEAFMAAFDVTPLDASAALDFAPFPGTRTP